MSRPFHRSALALIACAGALAGCASQSAASPPPAAANAPSPVDDEQASGLLEHHRYHHHGGVMLFIVMSLDTLGLPANERAKVEKIRSDLHTRMQPALTADRALTSALADGLDAAAFDSAKVDAAVAEVGTAVASVHDASAEALNELHAVLTPPERAALVDKVQSHYAVWRRANAEETPNDEASSGHLAMLAGDLGLSQEQTERIRAGMADGLKGLPRVDAKEQETQLKAFADAFRAEQFDAKSLVGGGAASAHLAGWGALHLAHFVQAASPVLSAEQRAILSKRLRDHAAHDPSAQAMGAP